MPLLAKRTYLQTIYTFTSISLLLLLQNCTSTTNSTTDNTNVIKEISDPIGAQMQAMLKPYTDTSLAKSIKLYNPLSVIKCIAPDYKTVFTTKMNFSNAAIVLKNFIDKESKYFGLYSKAYHSKEINELFTSLKTTNKKDAATWAKAELYLTDALLQIGKHVHKGRLYTDTSFKKLDTALQNQVLKPLYTQFAATPDSLVNYVKKYEPNFEDYDSLKNFIKNYYDNPTAVNKKYTTITYVKDSATMLQNFIARIKEEGYNVKNNLDSATVSKLIKDYQKSININATGKFTTDMVNKMNATSPIDINLANLTLDKYKNTKIKNQGNYVMVNIPAYTLRAFKSDAAVLESKVAVGKLATKTPIMESEISDIIVMPMWHVPPSILKQPGFIERKRKNPNFIVKGKSVVQKSGPGNALGNMKFNFKSGDAVYLHDTNEKWAFGASKRAVSHGCVRVQDYKDLAIFITTVSPLVERRYGKEVTETKIDTTKNDTVKKYKYVVKDSTVHTSEVITTMLEKKAHHELTVTKKVPIYIKYMTCTIRNGQFVKYSDIYGYDEALMEKYIKPWL